MLVIVVASVAVGYSRRCQRQAAVAALQAQVSSIRRSSAMGARPPFHWRKSCPAMLSCPAGALIPGDGVISAKDPLSSFQGRIMRRITSINTSGNWSGRRKTPKPDRPRSATHSAVRRGLP